jgi:predicted nucleotidyltransferase
MAREHLDTTHALEWSAERKPGFTGSIPDFHPQIDATNAIVNSKGLTLVPSRSSMTTLVENEAVIAAANLLRGMGASQVFVFGSLVKGELRPDSDIDMAVSGLPAKDYFSAVSRASDLLGRPVDLLDLDDPTPLVRHLLASGDLIRVG